MHFFNLTNRLKAYSLVFISMGISLLATGQSISVGFEMDYGSYNMKDLKQIQENIPHVILAYGAINIPYKIYHDFQPFYGTSVVIGFEAKKFGLHLLGGTNVTGSRLHYRDYSGELTLDQLVTAKHLSLRYSVLRYYLLENLSAQPSIAIGFAKSEHTLHNSAQVFEYTPFDDLMTVQSSQWFMLPSANVKYEWKRLYIDLRAGYHLQFKSSQGKVQPGFEDDWKLYTFSEEKNPNWSGYRLTAGIGCILTNKRRKEEKSI